MVPVDRRVVLVQVLFADAEGDLTSAEVAADEQIVAGQAGPLLPGSLNEGKVTVSGADGLVLLVGFEVVHILLNFVVIHPGCGRTGPQVGGGKQRTLVGQLHKLHIDRGQRNLFVLLQLFQKCASRPLVKAQDAQQSGADRSY